MFAISPRQQAEAVANANYETLKDIVLRSVTSHLFGRGVRLDRIDLEAAYNLAWHGVCQAIAQGRRVENLAGLLVDITSKRAIDIYRQRNEAMHADADVESHAVEVDLAERVDDQHKLERLFERLRDRLTDMHLSEGSPDREVSANRLTPLLLGAYGVSCRARAHALRHTEVAIRPRSPLRLHCAGRGFNPSDPVRSRIRHEREAS